MYEYDSRVRLSEVDQHRKMTLNAVLNYFQDCSTFHSEDRGVGMEFLESIGRMWVLRSWDIRVYRYPELAERVRVGTWPYAFGKMTGHRNFRLLDSRGETAACADTQWVFMDAERMRPARLDERVSGAYEMEPRLEMGETEEKIALPGSMEAKEPFPVHEYHLDVNRHVNNGQYVQMAGEYLPEGLTIRRMQAEYRKSALLGDMICPHVGRSEESWVVSLDDEEGRPYAVIKFN